MEDIRILQRNIDITGSQIGNRLADPTNADDWRWNFARLNTLSRHSGQGLNKNTLSKKARKL